MYAVILAGGGGTRLWPLSRPETPKPFLPLLGDRSLLQLTVERIVGHPELELTSDDVTVVTDRRYARLVQAQAPRIRVLAEPAGRNTAAAVALATIAIDRPEDEVMLVLPADQRITKEDAYRGVIRDAELELARGVSAFGLDSPLVTLGIQTDRPATEYGYLVPDPARRQRLHLDAYQLAAFEEKPTVDRAVQLLNNPGTAWNAGIFLWRRRAIRAALARYTGLLTLLEPVIHSGSGLASAYDQLRPLSIDAAVMEGAARDRTVVMGAMDVGWDDLGSWSALIAAIGGTGSGRVVPPGTPADAGPDDLVVERIDGRLALQAGPRAILGPNPIALLTGAAAGRAAVEALIDRVSAWEEQ
ncbi:MAG TPA: sugar phosphate nucleotidyltransferase [Candidatus Limnocylindrales bacterium]|nr:sugar phosphate nucleotidyltransferase [Candidatus Limnocylindrales bacterium]